MPIPTWVPGQVLAAADVNSWFVPLSATRTTDQSVTSSTTLVNDNTLFLPLAVNAVYMVEAWLTYVSGTGADMKIDWSVPAGATFNYSMLHNEGGGTGFGNSDLLYQPGSTTFLIGSTGSQRCFMVRGNITTAGTAGNLQYRFAQNTSSATSATMKALSWLAAIRVG